ncbi:metallophosphoesterase [Mucilaginibacter boryungensis]|uniref:Metallophosphoesterase n=1 Tax=Mucilaginibacter boryungensis TaxID=768480 RepID=A0ABR9XEY5_9SPHI|nr:metallophosphoesterase [Mucilaginibacter boryungensis]MBE9665821.1 metallophosphoesterase [Mucilaginibacter boryungensis]
MKRLVLFPLLLLVFSLHAQDSVKYRIILIGDAGELGKQQKGVLSSAAANVLENKTTVLYLGDNIYPTGIGLPGSKEEETTKNILRSQYQPMRAAGAPVYFIPGNHDWDRMGPKGLAKVKRAGEFLAEQKDTLLKMAPAKGCPDPTEIKINDDLVVIAFDSEWWLYIYNKDNPDADCDCKTNDEVIGRFKELLYKNRDKIIILADHHPFDTYGHHGGSYIWQDYLFPLTSVKSSLYIPLPVIGALYPFLRSTFDNPEDNGHPLYKTMIKGIDRVFTLDSNVVRVAGHEHGLQFINDEGVIQVVSGSGAKRAVVKKGKHSLFALREAGYVTLDLMLNKSMRFTYYANNAKDSVFKKVYTYSKPFIPVHIPVEKSDVVMKEDSITVSAHPSFNKVSKLHRLVYGENYRKEWAVNARLPIIKLHSYQGGLTPVRLGGGHQTESLLLKNKEGKNYILSNIEKYPYMLLPQQLRQTFSKSWLKDAMSAQFPYGAVVAAEIARAVKVNHTTPTIGWVAPDAHFGYYETQFAGKICLIEEREPGDSSINTGNMIKLLNASDNNRIDSVEFFKARLLDWFLGDWDEHEDQWRWQYKRRGNVNYYTAVPHDRAEMFFINQGVIPSIASRRWVARYLKGYNGGYRTINDFFENDHTLNTRFMTQIGYDQWMQVTRSFAAALTDDVLENSLKKLPLAVYRIRHRQLMALMRERRDKLVAAAETYYRFFNHRVDVKLSDQGQVVSVKDTLNGALVITARRARYRGKSVLFSRVFDPKITKEVRLYISKGDDSVLVDQKVSKIKVRIIGGNGHKLYNIVNAGPKVNVYEKLNTATFTGPAQDRVDKHLSNDTSNIGYVPTNLYHTILPLFQTGYNFDDGYYFNVGFKYIHQGFRKFPTSTQEAVYGHSVASGESRLSYNGSWVNAFGKADAEIAVNAYFPKVINFFGRSNQPEFNKVGDYNNYYRAKFNFYTVDATVRFQNLDGTIILRLGPSVQYYHPVSENLGRLVSNPNLIHTYDSATVNNDKVHAGIVATYIDDKRNNKVLTDWGVYVNVRIQAYAGVGGNSRSFIQAIPEARLYKSVDTKSNFVITERIGGGLTYGRTTYYQSLFLGGEDNLPGFKQDRFAGQQMMFNNLEARIKLTDFLPYILPGQFGLTAAHNIGRVWVKREFSTEWHNSFSGGIYISPSDMALFQLKGGYSKEGFYPYVNFSLTF